MNQCQLLIRIINEKYLPHNEKAMSGKLLFVEYGNITLQG